MIKCVKGNLLDSDCDYICHQVNCQGRMGSGIAKQISERWPEVFVNYLEHISMCFGNPLGSICTVPVNNGDLRVVNMFSQFSYGYDGKRYTSYDAFYNCLVAITREIPKGKTIAFPYNIGCGLGGGDWSIISNMIKYVLGRDYDVYIYRLEED